MRITVAGTGAVTLTAAVFATNALAGGGGWVNFEDVTDTVMPAAFNDPALSTNDDEEKDYAWGDVDNDGDIDLVCVRKQPFTSTGKRVNVLFMNEGIAEGHAQDGVFVDRTAEYASLSDVPGDNGFFTPTNDRDVQLHDLNNDGWLDMVTATTLTDNQAKHLSHPRIYMNLGESGGVWQGFRHEDARIPQMHATAGPRFCSVSAGDVTGDGFADLYFGDYDSGGSQIFDFNNRLLINDGNGFFTDETASRLTSEMSLAAFGAASIIIDINNDGRNDVVKQTSLNSPTHVAITYNDPQNQGFFNQYDTIYDLAPYFVAPGDLNQDGRMDLVIVDDGTDRYMINQSTGQFGIVNWVSFTLPGSEGFGGNAIVADLNNDTHQDIIITDVDVDIAGCGRDTLIYRNLGNLPNVGFQIQGNVIPPNMLLGVHDVAVIDIDQDGWLDLVMGRCDGTQVWRNVPPSGLVYSYPNGIPSFVTPETPSTLDISVGTFGGGELVEESFRVHLAIEDGPFNELPIENLGGGVFRASIPALPCTDIIKFFVEADSDTGDTFRDPPGAPITAFTAVSATGSEVVLRDDLEDDISGWTVTAGETLGDGNWERADPFGTIHNGVLAAPEDDATAGAENTMCFVTDNVASSNPFLGDVDHGYTYLETPIFDLSGSDATISYSRWFYCDNYDNATLGDDLLTEISNDGGATYVVVHSTDNTNSDWESVAFLASDYIVPTSAMRVRFSTGDQPNNSVTEAGIDNFQVEVIECANVIECTGDVDDSGSVDFVDLLGVLSAWGACPGCAEDLDGDMIVGFNDLLGVLSAWGPCP